MLKSLNLILDQGYPIVKEKYHRDKFWLGSPDPDHKLWCFQIWLDLKGLKVLSIGSAHGPEPALHSWCHTMALLIIIMTTCWLLGCVTTVIVIPMDPWLETYVFTVATTTNSSPPHLIVAADNQEMHHLLGELLLTFLSSTLLSFPFPTPSLLSFPLPSPSLLSSPPPPSLPLRMFVCVGGGVHDSQCGRPCLSGVWQHVRPQQLQTWPTCSTPRPFRR